MQPMRVVSREKRPLIQFKVGSARNDDVLSVQQLSHFRLPDLARFEHGASLFSRQWCCS
jgi:hypothetical protein